MNLYIKINIFVFLIFSVIYFIFFSYIVFNQSAEQTSIFPAQYFQDVNSTIPGLGIPGDSIFTEMSNSGLLMSVNRVLIMAVLVYLISSSFFFFFKKRRKKIKLHKKILVFPIFLAFCSAYFFSFILFPRIVFTPILLQFAIKSLKSEVNKDTDGAIHDVEKIREILRTKNEKVKVISGYGKYNVAVKTLTDGKMDFYKTMFVPTAAIYLANREGAHVLNEEIPQLYYYPETHRLVINDITGLDSFVEFLSLDMISDVNNKRLNNFIAEKGNPDEYKILTIEEYSEYYINKIKQKNSEIMDSNLKNKNENLKVINDCSKINADNEKIIENQLKDYQINCIDRKRYRDCSEFKIKIEQNKVIANNAAIACNIEVEKAKKYNSEIDTYVDQSLDNIAEVNTAGTLERNKAEQSGGVFIEPSTIYIKYDNSAYFMLTTSIHEFLHYIVSKEGRDIPVYFDEGMTDYITSNALGYNKYLSVAYSGYYAEMQILYSLLEKIPFDELMRVYIEGDKDEFKKTFEKYFPNVSYDEFDSMSEKIYDTTYRLKGVERKLNFFGDREYMWTQDVRDIRKLLGLKEYIWYSNLNNKF